MVHNNIATVDRFGVDERVRHGLIVWTIDRFIKQLLSSTDHSTFTPFPSELLPIPLSIQSNYKVDRHHRKRLLSILPQLVCDPKHVEFSESLLGLLRANLEEILTLIASADEMCQRFFIKYFAAFHISYSGKFTLNTCGVLVSCISRIPRSICVLPETASIAQVIVRIISSQPDFVSFFIDAFGKMEIETQSNFLPMIFNSFFRECLAASPSAETFSLFDRFISSGLFPLQTQAILWQQIHALQIYRPKEDVNETQKNRLIDFANLAISDKCINFLEIAFSIDPQLFFEKSYFLHVGFEHVELSCMLVRFAFSKGAVLSLLKEMVLVKQNDDRRLSLVILRLGKDDTINCDEQTISFVEFLFQSNFHITLSALLTCLNVLENQRIFFRKLKCFLEEEVLADLGRAALNLEFFNAVLFLLCKEEKAEVDRNRYMLWLEEKVKNTDECPERDFSILLFKLFFYSEDFCKIKVCFCSFSGNEKCMQLIGQGPGNFRKLLVSLTPCDCECFRRFCKNSLSHIKFDLFLLPDAVLEVFHSGDERKVKRLKLSSTSDKLSLLSEFDKFRNQENKALREKQVSQLRITNCKEFLSEIFEFDLSDEAKQREMMEFLTILLSHHYKNSISKKMAIALLSRFQVFYQSSEIEKFSTFLLGLAKSCGSEKPIRKILELLIKCSLLLLENFKIANERGNGSLFFELAYQCVYTAMTSKRDRTGRSLPWWYGRSELMLRVMKAFFICSDAHEDFLKLSLRLVEVFENTISKRNQIMKGKDVLMKNLLILFMVDFLTLLPCRGEEFVKKAIFLFLEGSDMSQRKFAYALCENRMKDFYKDILDEFDSKHRFEGKA